MRYSNYKQSQMDAECAIHDDQCLADIRRKTTPCKNSGFTEVGYYGECLKCGADQGEQCRQTLADKSFAKTF